VNLCDYSDAPSLPTTERSEGVSPTSEARREHTPADNKANKQIVPPPQFPPPRKVAVAI
jgi:hypothetical protein